MRTHAIQHIKDGSRTGPNINFTNMLWHARALTCQKSLTNHSDAQRLQLLGSCVGWKIFLSRFEMKVNNHVHMVVNVDANVLVVMLVECGCGEDI